MPLRGLDVARTLLLLLGGHLGGHLSEGSLVLTHVDGESLEVVKLAGETHGTAVHEHPVAGLVGDLVDLEHTLALHGRLSAHEEVLADALGLTRADGGKSGDGVEEVPEGGKVAALTLGNVLLELVSASGGVGLEGEVVIRNLLVVTLDGLEELVSGTLNTLGDLDEHGALGGSKVLTSTVRGLLGASLTHLDGAHELLVEVSVHGLGLGTHESAVLLSGHLVVTDHTSEASEERLSLTVVGGHSVGEGGQTSTELTLGAVERGAGAGRVGSDASGVALVHHHGLALDASELAVELLGGTSEILGGILV